MLKTKGVIEAEKVYLEYSQKYGAENIPAKSAFVRKISSKVNQDLFDQIEIKMRNMGILNRKMVVFKNVLEELGSNEQAIIKKILLKNKISVLDQKKYKEFKLAHYINNSLLEECEKLKEGMKLKDIWAFLSKSASDFIKQEIYNPTFYYNVKFQKVISEHESNMEKDIYTDFLKIVSKKIIQDDNRFLGEDQFSIDLKNCIKYGEKFSCDVVVEDEKNYLDEIESLFSNNTFTVFGMKVVFVENFRKDFSGEYGYRYYMKKEFISSLISDGVKIWDRSPKTQATSQNDQLYVHHETVNQLAFSKMISLQSLTSLELSMISQRAKKQIRAKINKAKKETTCVSFSK